MAASPLEQTPGGVPAFDVGGVEAGISPDRSPIERGDRTGFPQVVVGAGTNGFSAGQKSVSRTVSRNEQIRPEISDSQRAISLGRKGNEASGRSFPSRRSRVRTPSAASRSPGFVRAPEGVNGPAAQAARCCSGHTPVRARSYRVSGARSAPPGHTTVPVSASTVTC